ncbi:MAG: tRNA threonylcarbamoyladenosine dehydratase [Planctomycetes bacterium]|nr:tRNA threonylcarbamoyladenosine dehydratase [Planctomycetota bacterium]
MGEENFFPDQVRASDRDDPADAANRTGDGGAAWLGRTAALLGHDAVEKLARSRITVFGLGAVGSYAVEGLARSGVGNLRLVDFDVVAESNLNRQLYALRSTIGIPKVELAAARVVDINPDARVEALQTFAHADTLPQLLDNQPDLVIDAIDRLNPKVEVIAAAVERNIPVFSSLGAATRTDADAIRFGPLFDATVCPLGRLVRKRLRRRAITAGDWWCVYSTEPRNRAAVRPPEDAPGYPRGRERNVLGSLATLTGMFGLRLAHEAVRRVGNSLDPSRI